VKNNILRKQTGNVETAHALIVKNSSKDKICLFTSCFKMASTNHYAGIHCWAFSHEWRHCFNKLTGALNGEKVVPELVNLYKLPFYHAAWKNGAAILTKKLHRKGVLLPKDVIFFAPCQHVGSIKGCEAVLDSLEAKGFTREEASSVHARQGYDGSLDAIVAIGIVRARMPYILWKVRIRRQHQRHCCDRNCSRGCTFLRSKEGM
jgi:hypothetical protein